MTEKWINDGDLERRREFGRWLKQIRESKELTQNAASQLLGYQYYTTLSQFERGVSPVPMRVWANMAKVYGVNPKAFAMRGLQMLEPEVFAMLFSEV